jgi:hypothetical protein
MHPLAVLFIYSFSFSSAQGGAHALLQPMYVSGSGYAMQTGPTLKETGEWLKTTLEQYGGFYSNGVNSFIDNVQLDAGCNLTYAERVFTNDHPKWVDRTFISIPLGAVVSAESDLTSISDAYAIVLKTGDIAAIQKVGIYHSSRLNNTQSNPYVGITLGQRPTAVPGGLVPQSPEQIGPRVLSAIQHAVSLCRSSYAAPTRPKEPF